VVERRRGQYLARLDSADVAYVDTENVRLSADTAAAPSPPATVGAATLTAGAGPELRIPAAFAPFLVETDSAGVHVTVYGPGALAGIRAATDSFVTGAVQGAVPGGVRVDVSLSRWLWGYRAFFDRTGTLVVQIRRPPVIDAANPLRGMRIVVDPGHPPAGATGPTGYQEKDANLAIALRVADKLRAAGADVRMTRTGDYVVDLAARPKMAVDQDAVILLSIHNNAYGDEANPYRDQGTSTYWFQPNSADLARALDREIDGVTGLKDFGAKWGNLALVRPTWMPSTLTESLFMPVPEQEAALKNPGFLDRLADAHVRALADFLRQRAGR
jgi:N-acetylmuramoyl-L-alanine amidase